MCKPGSEEKFWKLVQKFRGEGFYVPVTVDENLDKATIVKNLPLIEEKIRWIEELVKELEGKNNFKVEINEINAFFRDLNELQLLKERYYDTNSPKQKKSLKNESRKKWQSFSSRFKTYLKTQNLFHSFRFPVDHLNSRKIYDENKHIKKSVNRKKANEIYFYRKLTEDGSYNKNYKKTDRFLRTLINTTYLKLDDISDFISEDVRFDIYSLLDKLKSQMRAGVKHNLKRVLRWKEKTQKSLRFYKGLRDDKVQVKGKTVSAKTYIKDLRSARKDLENFVLEKEAEVYKYWTKQSEINRVLFVMSTILYNEVGRIDGHDALERKDVLHVVMNRFGMSKYNNLDKEKPLYSKISPEVQKNVDKYKWLNVLFKQGEFSFTYYFISSSVRIFCPDMTRIGRRLRAKNLKIALGELKRYQVLFPGVRYFSRASMLGRIRMDSLWSDYKPIAERPGRRIRNPKRLREYYKRGKYEYLYHFESENKRWYKVVIIGRSYYVIDVKNNAFYTYRNPHYFRYFASATKR